MSESGTEQTKRDVFRGVASSHGCDYCGRNQCCNCNWSGADPKGKIKKRPHLGGHYACDSCYSAVMHL